MASLLVSGARALGTEAGSESIYAVFIDTSCRVMGSAVLPGDKPWTDEDTRRTTVCRRVAAGSTLECVMTLIGEDRFRGGKKSAPIRFQFSEPDGPRLILAAWPDSMDTVVLDWSLHTYVWSTTRMEDKIRDVVTVSQRQCVGSLLTGAEAKAIGTRSPPPSRSQAPAKAGQP